MNWYLKVLKQFADFNGRARRKEYWMFFLFNIIFSIVAGILDSITGTYNQEVGIGLLGGIYSLAMLIPGLAVCVRRLHDTGKSGWMIFVALIPLLEEFGYLFLWLKKETRGTMNMVQIQKENLIFKSNRNDRKKVVSKGQLFSYTIN